MKNDLYQMHAKTTEKLNEPTVWKAIKTIYRLLATSEAQLIIPTLEKNTTMRSKDLMTKTGLTESQFHPVMKDLVKYGIIDRVVDQDRSVSYSISAFGIYVLDLSSSLMKEVKDKINEEIIAS